MQNQNKLTCWIMGESTPGPDMERIDHDKKDVARVDKEDCNGPAGLSVPTAKESSVFKYSHKSKHESQSTNPC
jgi:hypothetical protein